MVSKMVNEGLNRVTGGLESLARRFGADSPTDGTPWGAEKFAQILGSQGIDVPNKIDDQGQPVLDANGGNVKLTPAEIPKSHGLYKQAQEALSSDPRLMAANAVRQFGSGVASDVASSMARAGNSAYHSIAMSGNRKNIGVSSSLVGPWSPHSPTDPFNPNIKINMGNPQDPNAPKDNGGNTMPQTPPPYNGPGGGSWTPPAYAGPGGGPWTPPAYNGPGGGAWTPPAYRGPAFQDTNRPPVNPFAGGVADPRVGRPADTFAAERVNPFAPRPASSTMSGSSDGSVVNPFAPRIRGTRSSVEPGNFGAPGTEAPARPSRSRPSRPRSGGNPKAIEGILGRDVGESNWGSTVLRPGGS